MVFLSCSFKALFIFVSSADNLNFLSFKAFFELSIISSLPASKAWRISNSSSASFFLLIKDSRRSPSCDLTKLVQLSCPSNIFNCIASIPSFVQGFSNASGSLYSSSVNIIEVWDKKEYEISVSKSLKNFGDLAEEVMGDNSYLSADDIP